METHILLFYADSSFTSRERRLMQRAADEWYIFTRGSYLFHFEYGLEKWDLDTPTKHDVIYRSEASSSRVRDFLAEHKARSLYGLCSYHYDRCVIDLLANNMQDDTAFQSTVMHELGHFVGMGHIEGSSIMNKSNCGIIHFTELDAKEMIRVYPQCTLDSFTYCAIK